MGALSGGGPGSPPAVGACLSPSAIERFAEERPMRSVEDAADAAHLASCARCAAARDEARRLRVFLAGIAPALRRDGAAAPNSGRREAHAAPAAGDEPPPASVLPLEGGRRVLHGYRLLAPIGQGGQGQVWRAVHEPSGRPAAVKVLHGASAPQRLRMQREAQLAATLRHPGIVDIFDCGALPDSGFAIAMELVDGVPLDEWARTVDAQTPDAAERARRKVRLGARICAALHHAHQHGVIHRDLKPGNILVEGDDAPRIVDFGLARAADEGSGWTVTRSGEFAGTLAYAAPEQLAAGEDGAVGTPADLYSLGIVLYEAIAGRPPYDASGSIEQAIGRVLHVEPPIPRHDAAGAAIELDLATIVLKAIAKEPARRYDSAAAMRDDLERWLEGRPIAARRASVFYVLGKLLRRRRGAVRGIAAAVLAVGVLAAALWFASRDASEARASRAELFRSSENAVGKSLRAARVADDWLEQAGQWVEAAEAGRREAVEDARRLGAALREARMEEARRLAREGELDAALRLLWLETLAPSAPAPGVLPVSEGELDELLRLLRELRAEHDPDLAPEPAPAPAEIDRWIERLVAEGAAPTNVEAICAWAEGARR